MEFFIFVGGFFYGILYTIGFIREIQFGDFDNESGDGIPIYFFVFFNFFTCVLSLLFIIRDYVKSLKIRG